LTEFIKLTHQLKRFIVTGIGNTVFGYLVYAFIIIVFDLSYFWALILTYSIGITFSFTTFRAFVFTDGDRGWRSYIRFILTYVGLLIVNIVALHILVDIQGIHKLIAQLFVIPFCAAISFIINRIFVFK